VSDWDDEDDVRRPEGRSRQRRFSIWTLVAPIALLASVSVIVVIARGAGWVGKEDTTTTAGTRSGAATSTNTSGGRARTTPTSTGARTRVFYTIQSGDTLEGIALRFGTTIAKLEALNPGVDPQALRIGQRIRLR
jgi:hypothetical protein